MDMDMDVDVEAGVYTLLVVEPLPGVLCWMSLLVGGGQYSNFAMVSRMQRAISSTSEDIVKTYLFNSVK